jgi:hypothetical protein
MQKRPLPYAGDCMRPRNSYQEGAVVEGNGRYHTACDRGRTNDLCTCRPGLKLRCWALRSFVQFRFFETPPEGSKDVHKSHQIFLFPSNPRIKLKNQIQLGPKRTGEEFMGWEIY